MNRRHLGIAPALLLAVAVAACSGGGGGDPKQRWIEASARLCDTRAHAVEVASAQLTADSTAEQFAAFFRRFYEPAYRTQLDGQRKAGPPDDTARALVDDTAKVLDAIKADPGAFAVAVDPFADVDARWDAYGLRACGTRTAAASSS